MRIAVIGGGGREHALAWKLSQSVRCEALFCVSGNGGTVGLCENVVIGCDDYEGIVGFAISERIDLVVIGGEQALAAGLGDMLRAEGIKTVGCSALAARLESSKAFAKDFCVEFGIPSAESRSFVDKSDALSYISERGVPIVVKADGLAGGKGVVVAETLEQAYGAVEDIMGGAFGSSGDVIVIEDFLVGREVSFFVLCDGETAVPLLGVQDYKSVYDGGRGANTGGMGTYAPVPFMSSDLESEIMDGIVYPTLAGMGSMGCEYSGVLFLGLMVCRDGVKLIEYNVRFGDPECQILMVLLESDLVEVLDSLCLGSLSALPPLSWRGGAAVNVVMAAEGYPGCVVEDIEIGLGGVCGDDVVIFHGATMVDGGGILRSCGGRVLNVVGFGGSVVEARELAYGCVGGIDFPRSFYRSDIGL